MSKNRILVADVRRYKQGEMLTDDYVCGQHCDKTPMLSAPQRFAGEVSPHR